MGQAQTNLKKASGRNRKHSSSDEDEVEAMRNEAAEFIDIYILYELPGGSVEEKKFRINPAKRAKELKSDLEINLKIPKGKIKIYFDTGTQEMPNNPTLKEIYIKDGCKLRVRDGSLRY